jgi:hypothetical protein
MKSVYICSKGDGTMALAIDIPAIADPKVIGAFLKLAGESGLIIDRVEPYEVQFTDRPLLRKSREEEIQNKQLELPADGERLGPSEMGEGFVCNYSGACPHENQSCSNCDFAGSIFGTPVPTSEAETPAAVESETKAEGPTLADEMKSSAFAQWATMSPEEREAAGVPVPESVETAEMLPEEEDAVEVETAAVEEELPF